MRVLAVLAVALAVSDGRSMPKPFWPEAMAFWDGRTGLFAGRHGGRETVLLTRDGGLHWRVVRSGIGPFGITVVRGGADGWITTRLALLHTADRGRTWEVVAHRRVAGPSFATPRLGWAWRYTVVGRYTRLLLLRTVDGGRTWREGVAPCSRRFGESIVLRFPMPRRGWLLCAGQPGAGSQLKELYETRDGGRTWLPRDGSVGGYVAGMDFLPSGYGWVWTARGSFSRTLDGGRHWRPLPISAPESVEAHAASLVDRRRGYAALVYFPPRLAVTDDGGLHWRTVAVLR